MIRVLELLVMSHTVSIDRVKEKTYRNTKETFFHRHFSACDHQEPVHALFEHNSENVYWRQGPDPEY
jgi:hypothetical protein